MLHVAVPIMNGSLRDQPNLSLNADAKGT
jgi:hypothetical protein